jgi:hypothetical protein
MKQAEMGESCSGNGYRILLENHEGKRPFGRPSRRWENNIKCTLNKYVVCEGVDWIQVAETSFKSGILWAQ